MVRLEGSRLKNFLHFQRDPLSFMLEMLDKGDVISLSTGTLKASFVINSPEFIRAILVTHESELIKGRSSAILRRTIGDGLLTTENEQHRYQRKYMQPAFYKDCLQHYAKTVVKETETLVEHLKDSNEIDVHTEMMKLTLSIIAKTMFQTSVDEDKKRLAEAVDVTIQQTARTLFSPIPLPLFIPTKGNRKHKQAIDTLENMVYKTLNQAKKQNEERHTSLLGMLLDTKDSEGNALSDKEIRDQMMTMLLAGHETTANALTWVFYLLDKHPQVRKKLVEEVSQCTKPLGYESLKELHYVKQVIEETLRLYPPAWIILRESKHSLQILGETFPDKSSFLISPYAIHRNPEVFKDPLEFKPERFSPGNAYESFQYFPFGGGPRGCIGSRFAMMEAMLILAVLVERLSFVKINPHVEAEPLVSLRIRGGLPAKVHIHK